jgi:hypothetical protein
LQSVLLVDETGPGVPRENHWPVASHWQTLSHNIGLSTPRHERVRTHKVSGDRHWLHKSNYHTITTTHKLYIYLYKDIHKNKKNNYLYYLYIVLLYSYNYYPIKIIHDITWSYFIISVWSLGTPGPVSSTNKTDCNDITEILLKSGIKHHKPTHLHSYVNCLPYIVDCVP